MNVNRKVGNSFEKDLCRKLSEYGFWAHNLAQNSQGQPFDVIAARNGATYVIDCKVCDNDKFRLNRIEENQRSAMTLWKQTGNGDGWFAIRIANGNIYFVPLRKMEEAIPTQTVLYDFEIKIMGMFFDQWVKSCR